MTDEQHPPDYTALRDKAFTAGWSLSGGWAAGYRTPLTYSAWKRDSVWPNIERREFPNAAAVRQWVAAGFPSERRVIQLRLDLRVAA